MTAGFSPNQHVRPLTLLPVDMLYKLVCLKIPLVFSLPVITIERTTVVNYCFGPDEDLVLYMSN